MIQERSVEYEYLRDFYNREDNQIVILYGDRHNGLSEFVKDFLKGMDYFYYLARPCSHEAHFPPPFTGSKSCPEDLLTHCKR